MHDVVSWLGDQVAAVAVAGAWALWGAVRRRLGRRKKILGILAAHLPSVAGMSFERAANELTGRLSESLMGQEEEPPDLAERDLVRELLRPQRAQTATPPPLPPPPKRKP